MRVARLGPGVGSARRVRRLVPVRQNDRAEHRRRRRRGPFRAPRKRDVLIKFLPRLLDADDHPGQPDEHSDFNEQQQPIAPRPESQARLFP
jgi:hypothetical protein